MASLSQTLSATLSVITSSAVAISTVAETMQDLTQVGKTYASNWKERTIALENASNRAKMLQQQNQILNDYCQAKQERNQLLAKHKDLLTKTELENLFK